MHDRQCTTGRILRALYLLLLITNNVYSKLANIDDDTRTAHKKNTHKTSITTTQSPTSILHYVSAKVMISVACHHIRRRLNLRYFSLQENCRNFSINAGERVGIRIPEKASPKIGEIVNKALELQDNITVEAGSSKAAFDALKHAISSNKSDLKKVTVDIPFGYRHPSGDDKLTFDDDIPIFEGEQQVAIYNNSSEYLNYLIDASSHLSEIDGVETVFLVHNPEVFVQANQGNNKVDNLQECFQILETACHEGKISSYGISSNGMSLASDHPLHLSWRKVLDAALNAAKNVHGESAMLSTIQFPINLLERRGATVAKKIQDFAKNSHNLDVNIYASRPLTCYPMGGVGDGFPFKLVDYRIEFGDLNDVRWTHQISECPPHYASSLNAALGHFDGEELLMIEQEGERKMTVEERETLEGCRLLQSMLADLDLSLHELRSFEAYENTLATKVIPMIHNTFEELDEESARVLQVSNFLSLIQLQQNGGIGGVALKCFICFPNIRRIFLLLMVRQLGTRLQKQQDRFY